MQKDSSLYILRDGSFYYLILDSKSILYNCINKLQVLTMNENKVRTVIVDGFSYELLSNPDDEDGLIVRILGVNYEIYKLEVGFSVHRVEPDGLVHLVSQLPSSEEAAIRFAEIYERSLRYRNYEELADICSAIKSWINFPPN